MNTIHREAPVTGIFTPNAGKEAPERFIPNAPIREYDGYICPNDDRRARALGDQLAAQVQKNRIADFERTEEYCHQHGETNPDQMVHVTTFLHLDGVFYMTYYANTSTAAEDPLMQECRLAFCPDDRPEDMTIVTVQKAGDMLDDRKIDAVYDTILLYKGGDELYLLWTASADGEYYRFYCVYDRATNTLGPIRPNRFRVGDTVNDFSMTGIVNALSAQGLPHKHMFADIGIMQKLTSREENGELWYYTGAYSGFLNCIIRSRDFITWEYVAEPDFLNLSQWENAVYVWGDRCYYFVRQYDCQQGFLTCYDLETGTWAAPFLIRDTQSRSDFIEYQGELYLIHAPVDRNGFGIMHIDRETLKNSRPVAVADMKESCFYPFARVEGDTVYMSYTVDRRHVRLTHFPAQALIREDEPEDKASGMQ